MSAVTISGPGDLAAALPALVGFHPAESLVAVLLRETTVACTVRVDLPDDLTGFAPDLVTVAGHARATRVILAVYTARGDADLPRRGEVALVVGMLTRQGLPVADALLVDDRRWWSYLCDNPSCCPPDGSPVPDATTVVEAERVGHGLRAVAPDRHTVQAEYQPRPDLAPGPDTVAAARASLGTGADVQARFALEDAYALAYSLPGPHGLPDHEDQALRARLALLLRDVHVRDYLLARLATDETDLVPFTAAMVRLALTAPVELRPMTAATAAALLSATGHDPVALWAMVDLAEGVSLADLVRTSARAGLPPELVREAYADALPQVLQRLEATT